MSCSWFLLKPRHEIVKEIQVVGNIIVEIEQEDFVASGTQTEEIDVTVESEEFTATVDTDKKDVILDTEEFFVTIDGRVIFKVAQPASFIFREIPSGIINDVNTVFTLANIPQTNTEIIVLNGLVMKDVNDYTIFNDTITFVVPPSSGDSLFVNYIKA